MASGNSSEREFSIVVLGATGFTGKHVVRELAETLDSKLGDVAIAGRSPTKLQEVLASISSSSCHNRVKVIPNVDVFDYDTLVNMAYRARLVLNVVGPYRLYGEAVVKACIQAGTNYLDVCGEPEFMEKMEFKYSEDAKAAGIHMASACGYDSIPADVGTVVAQREFASSGGVPSSVEAYLAFKTGPAGYVIHFATWESAVLGMASVQKLRKLRGEIKAAGKAPSAQPLGPRPKPPQPAEYVEHPAVRSWAIPFPGADASVVRRTQGVLAAAGEPAVHFTARMLLASRFYLLIGAVCGTLMSILAKSDFGRALLLGMPGLFSYGLVSHAGPSKKQMDGCTSETILVVNGFSRAPSNPSQVPDRQLTMKVVGPDPGYYATSIYLVQAGLSVLLDASALPPPGIYTAGALLRNTKLVDRLKSRGIKIETVSDCSI